MTSKRSQIFTRVPVRAFTVVELLVAVSVLTLIVAVLFKLFDEVQKGLRSNVSQVDVLEGGRAAMQLIGGETGQMAAGDSPASTNLYIGLTAPPFVLPLLDPSSARTNMLDEVFFLTHFNKSWVGTGYRVLSVNSNGIATDFARNNVGTLCRYSVKTSDSDFPNMPGLPPLSLFWQVMNPLPSNLTNYQQVLDGVVHFRIRAYDTNGYLMNYLTNTYPNVRMTRDPLNIAPLGPPPGETVYFFTNTALPACLDAEVGILEPHVLERLKSMPPLAAASYFSNQVGAIHLFQQRVRIRTGQ